jgi:subtilase family serine protease
VALPDLVVSVAGDPPAAAKPGDKFQILVNIFNLGPIGAPASTSRHYLSTDLKKGAGDILLTGSGAVSALKPGGTPGDKWAAFVWVTIPSNTAVGTYHVLSCADDLNIVKETFEDNNCKASTATVNVTLPNLKIEAVSSPPSSIQRGHSFSVTDTVANTQPVSAGASTTRYYLSQDVFRGAGDLLLTGSRAVVALAPLGSASGSATVTVPSGTAPGVYHVLACADDLNVVKELIEQNNCNVAASTVTVTP